MITYSTSLSLEIMHMMDFNGMMTDKLFMTHDQ